MKKGILNFIFNCFLLQVAFSQNLVSNPGFETFSSCPNTASQLSLAVGWNTSQYSPDYFDACAGNGTVTGVPANICGYQQPASGDGYIGLLCYGSFASAYISNLREYATGTLTAPLVPGTTYNVSFKIVRMNESSHQVDHVGAKFVTAYSSNLAISNSAHVFSGVAISDTLNWTTISGTFVADSAYNFIVIGNHFDDANSIADSIQAVTFGWNAYYFVDDVEVTELSLPPVALFSAANHVCPGTCIDFNNLSVNGNTYLWNFQGANPSTSTDVNPTNICYNTPGNYTVQLIADNAYGSDTLTLANYITVYPYPAPQGISQSGDTLFAIAGAGTYQWYYNGVIVNGATDYYYIAQASGDYNVVATDGNGCEVEAVIYNVIADVPSTDDRGWWTIFPNPVDEELRIKNEKFRIGAAETIAIYNLLGERQQAVLLRTPNSLLHAIDVRQLPPGVYFLEITSTEGAYRAKFVKK